MEPAYGSNSTARTQATNSWGGTVLQVGAEFHLFVSEMANHCGLGAWTSASQCSHAVGASAVGPFAYRDTAVGVWCHNAHAVFDPDTAEYFLFHIGNGTHDGRVANCTRSEGDGSGDDGGSMRLAPPQLPSPPANASGSSLHVARDPGGPWLPAEPLPGGTCNNPAPARLSNGSWLLACGSRELFMAPSPRGPWAGAGGRLPSAPAGQWWEDATLWQDARGALHALFHAFTAEASPPAPQTCAGNLVSAHAFSGDGGTTWTVAADAPYANTFLRADGVPVTAATLERPKLFFGAGWGGAPIALLNGAASLPGGEPACTGTCNRCKLEGWTYTLARALNVS